MGIKVFISYSEKDQKLAKILKKQLQESQKIDEAFVFEDKKEYGVQIDQKITEGIKRSDYLVAIITQNGINSASVNQELGYAICSNVETIPMIEQDAEKGVFTHGTENMVFSQIDFKEKCIEVEKYILQNGPRQKATEDEELIQKSAHYRCVLEFEIYNFLNGVYYRFNIGGKNDPGMLDYGRPATTKEYLTEIKKFFDKEENELIKHMSKINFEMYGKLAWELRSCASNIKNAEGFPHVDLHSEERDAIIELKYSLQSFDVDYCDVEQYCKSIYDSEINFDFENCDKMIRLRPYEHLIQSRLKDLLFDLKKNICLMIKLSLLFLEYRKKFGETAFKRISQI